MTDTKTYSLPIYIIGDTPTAYLLAAKLTLAEENVCLINDQSKNQKEITFSFQDNIPSPKSNVKIRTDSLMHEDARMVIFSLSPEKINAGLSYFSGAKATNCPLISFCKTVDSLFIGNVLKKTIIPAYFNGWLKQNDNSLIFFGSPQGIQISMDENHAYYDLIQKILAKTYLKITFNPDDTQNFWNDFIPNAANNLFTLEYGPCLRDIAQKQDLRLAYTDILDELISVSPATVDIDKEQIISNVYLIPEKYKPSVLRSMNRQQSKSLLFMQDMLQKQPAYTKAKMPLTQKIITQNLKKLLSSVER